MSVPTIEPPGRARRHDPRRRRTDPAVRGRTPLLASPWPGLWLKPENLQPIGAFKIRGAVTAISRLDPEVRARGVLAHSSGNHAQAVAYAARAFGIDAHIVIPDNAPARKIQATATSAPRSNWSRRSSGSAARWSSRGRPARR